MNTNDLLSEIIVRDYQPKDYPAIIQLWELTGLGGKKRGDDQAVIEKSIALGGRLLVAVHKGGYLVGTSWMTFDGRRIHLHHLGVLPEFQRNGIGRLLIIRSLEHARNENVQIKLEVHRDNRCAVALYKQLGFHYLGDYDVYIIRSFAD